MKFIPGMIFGIPLFVLYYLHYPDAGVLQNSIAGFIAGFIGTYLSSLFRKS